jgi:hypothetical protein
MNKLQIWLKGMFAAAVSGGAGGVMTGLAAVGIDPQHYNLQSGSGQTQKPWFDDARFSLTSRPISYIMLTTKSGTLPALSPVISPPSGSSSLSPIQIDRAVHQLIHFHLRLAGF